VEGVHCLMLKHRDYCCGACYVGFGLWCGTLSTLRMHLSAGFFACCPSSCTMYRTPLTSPDVFLMQVHMLTGVVNMAYAAASYHVAMAISHRAPVPPYLCKAHLSLAHAHAPSLGSIPLAYRFTGSGATIFAGTTCLSDVGMSIRAHSCTVLCLCFQAAHATC